METTAPNPFPPALTVPVVDFYTSVETDKLWPALLLAQSNFEQVVADQVADTGKFKYSYADLASIIKATRPALVEAGLITTNFLRIGDDRGEFIIEARIIHAASGQFYAGVLPLKMGIAPQDLGSVLTYWRRYLKACLLDIASEDDDASRAQQSATRQGNRRNDNRQAAQQPQQRRQTAPQTPKEKPPENESNPAYADFLARMTTARQKLGDEAVNEVLAAHKVRSPNAVRPNETELQQKILADLRAKLVGSDEPAAATEADPADAEARVELVASIEKLEGEVDWPSMGSDFATVSKAREYSLGTATLADAADEELNLYAGWLESAVNARA